jgi:5'-nucleotidase (lipoprotein e(P4) family)
MQWLYGSGEGAASSIQAYHAFRNFVVAAARRRPRDSVVLAEGSTLDAPRFVPCGRRPLAVVLDVDETALQNIGYEYDDAVHPGRPYDQERWNRWEATGAGAVLPIPGAVTTLRAIRAARVTVIFNSNRMAVRGAAGEAALNGAGLGPARHGETLYLQGDVAPGSAKDPRRAAISRRYCVIAMAGDQLGDFSDLFNARTLSVPDRRRAAAGGRFASLWGNGWFVLSNPVYGSGLRGTIEDVFPADKRWSDPAGGNR